MLHSILMTSALAAAVLASPLQHFHKRDYVTVTLPTKTVVTNVATVTVVVPAGPAFAGDETPHAQAFNKDIDQNAAAPPAWDGNFGPGDGHDNGAKGGWPGWGGHTHQGNPPVTTQAQQPPTTTQAPPQQPPAPASTTAVNSAPPAQPPSSNNPYQNVVIQNHNIHRSNHSAPTLAWSDSLASTAQKIAESCIYAHNTDIDSNIMGYGQNIAAGVDGDGVDKVITNMFYNNEEPLFQGYGDVDPDMSNFEKWGHFSQIVWKQTRLVGCYTQYCPNGLANVGSNVSPYFTVCNYNPPGNVAGGYKANIGEPLGHPTVTAE